MEVKKVKNRVIWICEQCGSKANFKGLCRDCTEYGEQGEVINPVARVKHNADGSKWNPPKRGNRMPTMDLLMNMKNSRRRKPSKKQMKEMEDNIKSMAEFEGQINKEGDFMEFGESVEEE
tara:strand:+ start:841 stop:1200 length:360 start_codon:yes stop_codon:yes gene_type:complete